MRVLISVGRRSYRGHRGRSCAKALGQDGVRERLEQTGRKQEVSGKEALGVTRLQAAVGRRPPLPLSLLPPLLKAERRPGLAAVSVSCPFQPLPFFPVPEACFSSVVGCSWYDPSSLVPCLSFHSHHVGKQPLWREGWVQRRRAGIYLSVS